MVLFIIHIAITLLISFICSKNIFKEEFIFTFIIGFCFPIGGYIINIYIFLNKKSDKFQEVKDDELDEINNDVMLYTDDSIEKDTRDVIPLEEAMILNSDFVKKKQIKRVFESNELENLDFLKVAVKDTDIEVAHYASAAMLDIESKLSIEMQECKENYEKNPNNMKLLNKYINSIEKYLDSNLIEEHYEKKYINLYIESLEKLLSKEDNKEKYIKIIDALIKIENFEKAKKYSVEFSQKYECEESYIKELKLNYILKNKDEINNIIKRIKKSSVDLSRNGINILRFWDLGGES